MRHSMTEGRARPATRSFLAALACACLAGASWGLLNPSFRTLERIRLSVRQVETGGQDVNGDGIASAAEGAIDLDGDGRFGEAEAAFFRMESFIRWSDGDPLPDGPQTLSIPNSCCVTVMGGGGRSRYCMIFPPMIGVTCVTNGTTCTTI